MLIGYGNITNYVRGSKWLNRVIILMSNDRLLLAEC